MRGAKVGRGFVPVLTLTAALCAPGAAADVDSRGGRWVHEIWTVEDGLPVQSLTDVLQSRDGYLWVATFDGLARFDGVRFVVFDTGNTEGLPSNRIIRLHEDRHGALWLLTEQGHLVGFESGAFRTLDAGGDSIQVVHEDPDGGLWAGGRKGLYRIGESGLVPFERARIPGPVTALAAGHSGSLWVGLGNGVALRHLDGEVNRFERAGPSSGRIRGIFRGEAGTMWIATESGADVVREGVRERFDASGIAATLSASVVGVLPDGSLWLGTSRGFHRWKEGAFEPLHPDRMADSIERSPIRIDAGGESWFATSDTLYCGATRVFTAPAEIRAYAFDHEGSIWIATQSEGLHRLKPGLFEVIGRDEGLAADIVYPVIEDARGAVWAGTYSSGLSRIRDGAITTYTEKDGLPRVSVRSLHVDRDGTLWVGMGGDYWGGGVCRMLGERCEPFADERIRGVGVLAMHHDLAGTMWFGSERHGLFSHRGGSWRRWTTDDGLPGGSVRAIHESPDGTLWFGTNGGGLGRLRDDVWTNFTTDDGLSSNLIRAIYEDDEGALWIGTEGRGLNRIVFRGEDAVVTVYRKSDGLFDEVIHQVLEDDFGRLWMSSNRGLFWVSLSELRAFAAGKADRVQSRGYTERDGLRSREANGGMQPAGVKTRDGRLWFPTQAGVAVVDPSRLRRNEAPPPVVIEEIVTGGRTLAPRAAEPAEIAPDGRDLEIHYTALSLQEPSNVRFRYRLEGYDDDWVEAGNRRVAYFTNVPAGRYEMRVLAANNDGVWNLDGASVELYVVPRWFEQVWFRPAVALLLLLAAWTAYGWRARTLTRRSEELEALVESRTRDLVREKEASEKARAEAERQQGIVEDQAERLRELDEAKSRFFANVSHEFRTPLTLTIGPLEDLRDGLRGELPDAARNDVDLALRNSRRLLGFINEILEIARLESGQLELQAEPRDLGELVRDRCRAFSAMADRSGVELRSQIPDEPVVAEIDPELLDRVLDNLLANAFHHTPEGGTLLVTLAVTPGERARIGIRDTGPGIPEADLPHIFERFYRGDESRAPTSPSTGIGLALSKELVELHGGTIEAISEQGRGAEFVVTLPLSSAEVPAVASRGAPRPDPVMEPEAGPTIGPAQAAGDGEDVTTVLVVDDNPDLRAFVRRHLERHYRLLEAADGEAGLALARSELPDVIVSDVMMPKMDGQELCRAVRADPELECIPVVLLTARAATDDRIEGLTLGADDYLTKPFEPDELLARLANLIAARRRLRDRLRREAVLEPTGIEARSADEQFLERVRAVVEAHLGDEDFDVPSLAGELGMSRGHLHRRLRDVLSSSPTETVRSIRLDRAAQLLERRAGSVSEVAYATGFRSVSHFCRSFKARFGVTPTAYRDREAPPGSDGPPGRR